MLTEEKPPFRTNSWFLLYDSAPALWPVFVKDAMAKKDMTTLKHLPYSPNLVPDNFYLSPRLTLALKGWRFCDATDIIKNAAEMLKRL
jgi:hypothetical protein